MNSKFKKWILSGAIILACGAVVGCDGNDNKELMTAISTNDEAAIKKHATGYIYEINDITSLMSKGLIKASGFSTYISSINNKDGLSDMLIWLADRKGYELSTKIEYGYKDEYIDDALRIVYDEIKIKFPEITKKDYSPSRGDFQESLLSTALLLNDNKAIKTYTIGYENEYRQVVSLTSKGLIANSAFSTYISSIKDKDGLKDLLIRLADRQFNKPSSKVSDALRIVHDEIKLQFPEISKKDYSPKSGDFQESLLVAALSSNDNKVIKSCTFGHRNEINLVGVLASQGFVADSAFSTYVSSIKDKDELKDMLNWLATRKGYGVSSKREYGYINEHIDDALGITYDEIKIKFPEITKKGYSPNSGDFQESLLVAALSANDNNVVKSFTLGNGSEINAVVFFAAQGLIKDTAFSTYVSNIRDNDGLNDMLIWLTDRKEYSPSNKREYNYKDEHVDKALLIVTKEINQRKKSLSSKMNIPLLYAMKNLDIAKQNS